MLRILEILSNQNRTSKNLAQSINVAENTISSIVNGKSSPRLDTLEKIANALEVDIKDLFVSTHLGKTKAELKKEIEDRWKLLNELD